MDNSNINIIHAKNKMMPTVRTILAKIPVNQIPKIIMPIIKIKTMKITKYAFSSMFNYLASALKI